MCAMTDIEQLIKILKPSKADAVFGNSDFSSYCCTKGCIFCVEETPDHLLMKKCKISNTNKMPTKNEVMEYYKKIIFD